MKFGRFAIISVGLAIAICVLSWGFFSQYMPNMKEAELYQKSKEEYDAQANKLNQAKQRRAKAIAMVDAKAAIWAAIAATKTPPIGLAQGGIDLSVNTWQLSVDTPKFRNSIQRAVNAQVKKGGIKVVNGPTVPEDTSAAAKDVLATFYNYPALKFPVVIFDFGTITVQGTYKQIMDNVRSYKSMPHYLAVADGLRIDGTSPNLTATYNLSIVGYIRATKIAPLVNEGAAASAAGGGGGGGGRPGAAGGGPGPGTTGAGGPAGFKPPTMKTSGA